MNERGNRAQVLINDTRYSGQYVATASFNEQDVIASGDSPEIVLRESHKKGINSPVIFFVPEHNLVNVY